MPFSQYCKPRHILIAFIMYLYVYKLSSIISINTHNLRQFFWPRCSLPLWKITYFFMAFDLLLVKYLYKIPLLRSFRNNFLA